MLVVESTAEFRKQFSACVATIGKYDGMHLGHQDILRVLLEQSRLLGLPSLVILSEPQPEEFFRGEDAPPRLTPFDDKVALLEAMGIDAVYRLRFDEATSRMSAEEFVETVLVEGLAVKHLVIGHDFAFGHNRTGNAEQLRVSGKKHAFDVTEVDAFSNDGERVSSTLVRSLLEAGDCEAVSKVLGRPFSISGTVVEGRKLGRELGFPTANISLPSNRLPLSGVFAVRVKHESGVARGAANIGVRPTVDNSGEAHLEVYLLHFSGNLYGQHLTVQFLHKIRDEEKFASLEELKTAIASDVECTKAYFWKGEANVV